MCTADIIKNETNHILMPKYEAFHTQNFTKFVNGNVFEIKIQRQNAILPFIQL